MPLGDIALFQYVVVAAVAIAASVLGGVAGYGTGLVLPLVLVPLVGPEATVPIIGVSSVFTNFGRLWVFRRHFDRRKAALIAGVALPGCLLGAYGYTLLNGRAVTILIGGMLIVLVPARRLLARLRLRLAGRGLAAAGTGFGVIFGGTAGSGVLLLSILMAAGLEGPAVIATDAGISLCLSVAKVGVFQAAGAMAPSLWLMALLVGVAGTPGAFIARWLVARFPARVHAQVLEAAIVVGAVLLIARGVGG